MDDLLAVATAALGEPLSDPVDLGGSLRSTVLRCRGAGRTVIVKSCSPEVFAVEVAGLRFAALAPEILATDREAHVIVMADLGTHPSLADVLLGGSASAAVAGLTAWAQRYGRLAASSVGREDEHAALLREYGGGGLDEQPVPLAEALAVAGIATTPALEAEVARVEGDRRYPVFSPGDICPDNNVLTDDGLRMIDFEGAGYHSVFRDAAYTTMPFSTCWCVYRMPPEIRADVERTYRAEVMPVYPDLADDDLWRAGLRDATVAWTIDITAALLPGHFAEEPPYRRRRGPKWRQILAYRWEYLAGQLDDLPAIAAMIDELRRRTGHWNVEPMPLYPAFRGDPAFRSAPA